MDMSAQRERMVIEQLERRGIEDARVLAAMRRIPREKFVPEELARSAYDDSPLPIAERQTISQPYIVARMTEALELGPEDDVLEIGTGSGYGAAVLAEIARNVYTIERHATLAEKARATLAEIGCDNVHVRCGDGSLGWPEHAPFAAIVATAASSDVPAPLREQLATRGRLVVPVGPTHGAQELMRLRRLSPSEYTEDRLGGVRFVSLVGAEAGQPSAR